MWVGAAEKKRRHEGSLALLNERSAARLLAALALDTADTAAEAAAPSRTSAKRDITTIAMIVKYAILRL